MEFVVCKYITQDLYDDLENSTDVPTLERLLTTAFQLDYLDDSRRQLVLQFYIRNYGFCRNNAFDCKKTSTFLSLLHTLWERDSRLHSDEVTSESSCVYFENMLIKHSVERPPKSVQVFSREEVSKIYDYVMTHYYQHFQLFHYVFGVHARMHIVQKNPHDVEEPIVPLPLQS